MTKFFVQLLLSVLVGQGVGAGFGPDVKDKLTETWTEIKVFAY